MENMDKELTVPKWVLINHPKIPQMPQNLSAKLSAQVQQFGISIKKRCHWASVVHARMNVTRLNENWSEREKT